MLKRNLGFLWILLGIFTIFIMVFTAIDQIKPNAINDINKPLPWIIILSVFIPISIGFMFFGYYALKNEYKNNISTIKD